MSSRSSEHSLTKELIFAKRSADERELIPTELFEFLVFWLLMSQKPPIFLENKAILLKKRGSLAITHQYR